ncbi:MAG: citrate lyase subunit beta / citryl-CoA lyase [Thermoplasmata archaeon]|jgi:citrate lyase beta subunit|nr:citrate lyase subunit beta / citryl-CoA lyase [Thermoplasmata archaeon]
MKVRTLLYTPGLRADRLKTAWATGAADIVCADLEDAVPPIQKQEARDNVAAALRAVPAAPACRAVRVNAWGQSEGTWALADLEALVPARPDLLVLPKVESAAGLLAVQAELERLEAVHKAPPIGLVPILETAAGVVAARDILHASERVAAVCFGAEDLAADVGMPRTRDAREVLAARQWVVLCATAAGVPAIDMITADYRDLERTAAEAREARAFGFRGKMVVHPGQVAPVHAAFRPGEAELAWARKVLAAVEAAEVGEGGVVTVDGRMVDVPVVRQAQRVVADAE